MSKNSEKYFGGFWEHLAKAKAHLEKAGISAGNTYTNAGETASSLLDVGKQALTGGIAFKAASGNISYATAVLEIGGYVLPFAKGARPLEEAAKFAMEALCKNTAAVFLLTIAATIALAPANFIKTAENFYNTMCSAGKTISEVSNAALEGTVRL